ncbi:redoxin family protein [Winogradskyella sp. 3972H.M.0a.05]|uniref:redoxin family protein n=1 Tax=Winogradskyella sp. 3972H.M.0a.05 TaxID=2950277 RepID=UPI0033997383
MRSKFFLLIAICFFCFQPHVIAQNENDSGVLIQKAIEKLTSVKSAKFDFTYEVSIDDQIKEYKGLAKVTPNPQTTFGFDLAIVKLKEANKAHFNKIAKIDDDIYFHDSNSGETLYSPVYRLGAPLFSTKVKHALLLYQYLPVLSQYENVKPIIGRTDKINGEDCLQVTFNLPQYQFDASFWIGTESYLVKKIVDRENNLTYVPTNFSSEQKENINKSIAFFENSSLTEYNVGGPTVNDIAPNWNLENLRTNETVSLDQFKGKVVVLDFWATWCAPCLRSMPEMNKLSNEFNNDLVSFIGITYNEKGDALEHINNKGYDYIFLSGNKSIGKNYGLDTIGIPTVYVIDQNGKVVEFESGYQGTKGINRLRKTIQMLLKSED